MDLMLLGGKPKECGVYGILYIPSNIPSKGTKHHHLDIQMVFWSYLESLLRLICNLLKEIC